MDLITLGGMAKAMEEKKEKTIKALRELADAIEYGDFVIDDVSIVSESKNFNVEQCTYEISGFLHAEQ